MQPDHPISEEELHAYVDGDVDPARRLNIAVYLANHPLEAARTEAFRAQNDGIRALFDNLLDQRPPKRLRKLLQRHAARIAWRRRCAWGLALIAMIAVLLLGSHALSRLTPFYPGALISGRTMEHAPTDTEYPVIRPPGPQEKRRRGIDI